MIFINIDTKIIEIYNEQDEKIDDVVSLLFVSKIVAIPTETVYGLAADMRSEKAILNVYKAKKRPFDNPLILHVSSLDMAKKLVSDPNNEIFIKLYQNFWPGELTIILRKNSNTVSDFISRNLDSVAIRMPRNKIFLEIIKRLNSPIAAPSANLSSLPSPTKYIHVYNDLNNRVDAIVKSFDCPVGVESTVISLLEKEPVIVRPGIISKSDIEKVIGKIKILDDNKKIEQNVISPGIKYRHYSPNTKLIIFNGDIKSFYQFLYNKQNFGIIYFDEENYDNIKNKINIGSYFSEKSICANLYTCLREIDELNVNVCYIRIDDKLKSYSTFFNRIIKASGFNIING